MFAILGIPDLGPIAWSILTVALVVDLGIIALGIARARGGIH